MNKKQPFYAQLHMHTSESSACGESTGAQMARAARDAGYSLIVITDHFMNANIGCPRHLAWKDKVHYLFRGYRAAKDVGDRIGLTVLKGWETYTMGPEYLTYGLDEAFLLDNPDIADVPPAEYLRRVRDAGGFVSHAHPYRQAYYIPHFAPLWGQVDAYEVFNAHHDPKFNEPALREARDHGIIELAGADAHRVSELGGGAMKLPGAARDMEELILMLRGRECQVIERL